MAWEQDMAGMARQQHMELGSHQDMVQVRHQHMVPAHMEHQPMDLQLVGTQLVATEVLLEGMVEAMVQAPHPNLHMQAWACTVLHPMQSFILGKKDNLEAKSSCSHQEARPA